LIVYPSEASSSVTLRAGHFLSPQSVFCLIWNDYLMKNDFVAAALVTLFLVQLHSFPVLCVLLLTPFLESGMVPEVRLDQIVEVSVLSFREAIVDKVFVAGKRIDVIA